jgi:hypothetical protein
MRICTCTKRLFSVKSKAGYYGNNAESPFLTLLLQSPSGRFPLIRQIQSGVFGVLVAEISLRSHMGSYNSFFNPHCCCDGHAKLLQII